MTKNEIRQVLLNAGIKFKYQGRNKCFRTNVEAPIDIVVDASDAGFYVYVND